MKKNLHHGYKTFLAALEHIQTSPVKVKRFLSDNRLTSHEKKLLHCYLKIRENDFSLLSDLEADKNFDQYPFLYSLKCYFLGVSYLYKGESAKAEEYLLNAVPAVGESYNSAFINRMTFRIPVNLFYSCLNQKKIPELKLHYEEIQNLKPQNEEDLITLALIDTNYNNLRGNYPAAEEGLEKLAGLIPKMVPIQIISYLIAKIEFAIKIDHFSLARDVLGEMKKYRTFRLSSTYKFFDKLLSFLTEDEKLYVYDKDFKGHNDLYLMIQVISALDGNDLKEAEKNWLQLSALSPSIYKKDFSYQGDKCLFSLCLEKCLTLPKVLSGSINTGGFARLELKVIEAFQNSKMSKIKKEDLFYLVYGKEVDSKDELNNLSTLITRINKKRIISIEYSKGCYLLKTYVQESAS